MLAEHRLVQIAQQRREAVAPIAGEQLRGLAPGDQLVPQAIQRRARRLVRGQIATHPRRRVDQQPLVIALQQQKGLGVARDDVRQPAAGGNVQFRVPGRLAHQLERGLQLAGVGLETVAVQGPALGKVLAQDAGGPLAEASGTAGMDPVPHGDDGIKIEVLDLIGLAVRGSCCIFCNN